MCLSVECVPGHPTKVLDLSLDWLVDAFSQVDFPDFIVEEHDAEEGHCRDTEMGWGNHPSAKTNTNPVAVWTQNTKASRDWSSNVDGSVGELLLSKWEHSCFAADVVSNLGKQ